MPTASSPSGISRDRDRDWMGASQSISMVVGASNRPARAPSTSWPSASRSSRVSSRNCRVVAYRHSWMSSGVGLASWCHRAGMVVSTRAVLPVACPVRVRRAALTACSSTGPNGTGWAPTRWEPTRPRMRVSQRPKTTADRARAEASSRVSQCCPSGPNASGLIRAGRPGPMLIGSTPRARQSGSYSSLGSPRTRVR